MRHLLTVLWVLLLFLCCCQHIYSRQDAASIIIAAINKNNDDILDYWLQYHTYIFGIKNILLLDQSRQPEAARVLRKWEARGLKVLWNQLPPTSRRAALYNKTFEVFPNADVLMQMEVHEFITHLNEDKTLAVNTSKKDIIKHITKRFKREEGDYPCFQFCLAYIAVPTSISADVNSSHLFAPTVKKEYQCKLLSNHMRAISTGKAGGLGKECMQDDKFLAFRNYYFRSPIRTVKLAVADLVRYNYLPVGTTDKTVHEHIPQEKLNKWKQMISRGHAGTDRLNIVRSYVMESLNTTSLIHPLEDYPYPSDSLRLSYRLRKGGVKKLKNIPPNIDPNELIDPTSMQQFPTLPDLMRSIQQEDRDNIKGNGANSTTKVKNKTKKKKAMKQAKDTTNINDKDTLKVSKVTKGQMKKDDDDDE